MSRKKCDYWQIINCIPSVTSQRSSYSMRLIQHHCIKERYRRLFVPTGITLYNSSSLYWDTILYWASLILDLRLVCWTIVELDHSSLCISICAAILLLFIFLFSFIFTRYSVSLWLYCCLWFLHYWQCLHWTATLISLNSAIYVSYLLYFQSWVMQTPWKMPQESIHSLLNT